MTNLRVLPLLVALVSCGAAASEPRPQDGSRVVVFKNGHALVVRTFSAVTDERGEVHLDDVPDAAVLGTFWATSTRGDLHGMHAGLRDVTEKIEQKIPARSHIALIAANVGKKVEIRYRDDLTVTGEIREALVDEGAESSIFVLATADGDVVLSTEGIRTIVTKTLVTHVERERIRTTKKKRLTLRFDARNARRDITLTYFRPGVRWIPTYKLDLGRKGRAKLTMQAELINEAEDLTGLPIDIVVGVPNFRFEDTVSPLVLEAQMKRALAQVAPSLMSQSQSFSNASYAMRSTEHRAASAAPTVPSELAGSLQNDLFVFSLPAMNLKRGDRAAVRVFERTVAYRDVYTWDLHLRTSDGRPTPASTGSPLAIAKNEVWHQLELVNDGDTAWTTGAVMIMSEGRPLAQELLTYTSRGDRVRVPVTVSVETRGTAEQTETARKLDALSWDGHTYAQVANLAKLSLCNHKARAIDVEVTLHLGGRATKASDKGAIALGPHRAEDWTSYRGATAVNNSSTVTWKKRLGSGETFEPTVAYHHFTMR